MILLFPDADTVRLALTSGLVPADVTLAPAAVSTDAQGRLYVEPSVGLSRATGKVLDRLGVKGSKRHGGEVLRDVGSWVELVPLAKEPGTPEVASGMAVLFELPSADDLPAIVTEMLRLGNDRQGFRWFAGAGEADATRVLLRVLGPPYYTLLRALDAPAGGVRAYLERAPRVWVEFGWTHPLAAQVKVAEGQFALLTPPDRWLFLDDAPFRDVYDLARFPLPAAPVAWTPVEAPQKVSVPLRLTAGNAADAAELWVLRDDPVAQLDALVRDADERLTQRLMFAVAKAADGAPVAVLRTRPSKLPPPALPLEGAAAFKPYWKLPNLFVPVGKRLHPTLRRDAVRRLLADDADRIVWLYPDGKTGFTPESVPDAAFRSLEDWVDYVIESEQAALGAWVGATRFDFDHFVCTDGPPKPKPDKPDREPRPKDEPEREPKPKSDTTKAKGATRTKKAEPAEYVAPPPEAVAPNEWKLRAKELEQRFLEVDGGLDAPERTALWEKLGEAYTRAGDAAADAAVCWVNAIWDAGADAGLAARWVAAELPNATRVGAAELDAKLKLHTPAIADARAVIAVFFAASTGSEVPRWLADRVPAVQKYLDTYQDMLPVRAVWLAAVRLARLAGGDPLGLARVRDGLVKRLLTEGLKAERDLPGFLRYAGLRDAVRLRAVREKALDLHAAARTWTAHHPATVPYVDLLFSFALARLGEAAAAKELLESARRLMVTPLPASWRDIKHFDEVTSAVTTGFLYAAFAYRIDEAVAVRPHAGPLAAPILDELDGIAQQGKEEVRRGANEKTDNPFKTAEHQIAKMREVSRVLDPEESREAYAMYMTAYSEPFRKELLALVQFRDPNRLSDKVLRLAREGFPGKTLPEVHFYLLHEALPLANRVGEKLAAELLRLVPGVIAGIAARPPAAGEAADILLRQGQLVERAIFTAANFGRVDLLHPVLFAFTALLRARPETARFKLINVVTGSFLRGLKRLGLRDEIDRFLAHLQAEILQGATPAELRKRYTDKAGGKPDDWAAALQTLLNLAAGWLTFERTAQALPILNEAREELLRDGRTRLPPKPLAELLRVYVATLGHGPADLGLTRIAEILTRFDPKVLPNVWTGNRAFSLFHFRVVEEVVWAIVSDEFALGPTGKKWLDEDEYLIRKRVHADMARERERGGV